jgi:hypothetical protein
VHQQTLNEINQLEFKVRLEFKKKKIISSIRVRLINKKKQMLNK